MTWYFFTALWFAFGFSKLHESQRPQIQIFTFGYSVQFSIHSIFQQIRQRYHRLPHIIQWMFDVQLCLVDSFLRKGEICWNNYEWKQRTNIKNQMTSKTRIFMMIQNCFVNVKFSSTSNY